MNILGHITATYICSCCRDTENVQISAAVGELTTENMYKYITGPVGCSNCRAPLILLSAKFKMKGHLSEDS